MRYLLLYLLCWSWARCGAQFPTDSIYTSVESPSFYAQTRSTHPLGIFLSRTDPSFRTQAVSTGTVSATVSSGNLWLPRVVAYHPTDVQDQVALARLPWHERAYHFDTAVQPAERMALAADGVMRLYQLRVLLPLSAVSELSVGMRGYSLDRGRVPTALLVSDAFIEWFHSNIAGGEDPFGRRRYGFDGAGVLYSDTRGRELRIDGGDVGLAGITTNYRLYPQLDGLARHGIRTSIGGVVGINTSRINPTVDVGLEAMVTRKQTITDALHYKIGLNVAAIRQGAARFGEGVRLTDRTVTYSSELLFKAGVSISRVSALAFAISFNAHSAYFRRGVDQYHVLNGDRVTTHWPYAITHLYKPLSATNFLLGYQRIRTAYSVYLRQDFLVDNAPDLQAGLGVRVGF